VSPGVKKEEQDVKTTIADRAKLTAAAAAMVPRTGMVVQRPIVSQPLPHSVHCGP